MGEQRWRWRMVSLKAVQSRWAWNCVHTEWLPGSGRFSPQTVSRVLASREGDPHISPPEEAHLTETPLTPPFQALRQKPKVLLAEQQGILAGFTSNDRLEA